MEAHGKQMLKTEREKAICQEYGSQDETGHVHCAECPLRCYPNDKLTYGMCKATCHYDERWGEWVPDEVEECTDTE